MDIAIRLADEVLFPAAMEIDAAPEVPKPYLDQIAAAGLYGLFGPTSHDGLDADPVSAGRAVEVLGGGSLVTAFVWIQHHSAVRAVAAAPDPDLRRRWLSDLCAGRVRAGIAYAALRRPGPPSAIAAPTDSGGWVLNGFAPWVTGWGLVDVILVGARAGGDVVWLLIDAVESDTCKARPVNLAALQASATVEMTWTDHLVPAERMIGREPFADWLERDARGHQLNGHLALGVAARCCRLLGPSALDAQVAAARVALDGAGGVEVRADVSVLAVRSAAALVAAGGGRSVEADQHASRLMREAMFLLVFGQTATIRAAQLARLTGPGIS